MSEPTTPTEEAKAPKPTRPAAIEQGRRALIFYARRAQDLRLDGVVSLLDERLALLGQAKTAEKTKGALLAASGRLMDEAREARRLNVVMEGLSNKLIIAARLLVEASEKLSDIAEREVVS